MSGATVRVPLDGTAYDIRIGPGVLAELPEVLAAACPAARYAVVTDDNVAGLHGAAVLDRLAGAGLTADLVAFPAGEWNKTREVWAEVTDRLLTLGLGRDAALLALGGGVTGDLAGFVAATYLRGIPCVQLPTTLLAMIDSSVGGKTGVDTNHGKNLVGAFHQPRAVLADVTLLKTLPPPHLAAGVAEALKHGAIADASYFAEVVAARDAIRSADPDTLTRIVARSVAIKAEVVAADEREAGRRAILNFGHTVAHAIEAVTRYEVLHGEAVALGMLLEAELGHRAGVTDADAVAAIRDALSAFALPLELPTDRVDDLLDAMHRDKKARAGTVRFALVERLGQPARTKDENWTVEVDVSLIRDVLKG